MKCDGHLAASGPAVDSRAACTSHSPPSGTLDPARRAAADRARSSSMSTAAGSSAASVVMRSASPSRPRLRAMATGVSAGRALSRMSRAATSWCGGAAIPGCRARRRNRPAAAALAAARSPARASAGRRARWRRNRGRAAPRGGAAATCIAETPGMPTTSTRAPVGVGARARSARTPGWPWRRCRHRPTRSAPRCALGGERRGRRARALLPGRDRRHAASCRRRAVPSRSR